MITIRVKAKDMYSFLNIKWARCYAYLEEGTVIFKKHNDKLLNHIIATISINNISCSVEVLDNSNKNYYVDVYDKGRYSEYNGHTHINTADDLTNHLSGEESYDYSNVDDLVTVTSTVGEFDVDWM